MRRRCGTLGLCLVPSINTLPPKKLLLGMICPAFVPELSEDQGLDLDSTSLP